MNAEMKLAKQRLTVLELAEALGNVTEACRKRGMARTQFYAYKRRFQTHGLEGLKDLPPIHKSHPMTTPPELVSEVLDLSLDHPSYGCNRLEALLMVKGKRLSSVTIQKILIENKLGARHERWLALEQKNADKAIELSAEQIALIEKLNPCFKERHVESSCPGEWLSQDTLFVGVFKGVGKVYMHTVVDTFSSYAFGFLHISKQPEAAVSVLHNDVLPFYKRHKLSVGKVLTDNGREFCGTENHPYELYLALHDVQHRRTQVRRPQTNGFVERFHRTALDEFYRVAMRQKMYGTVESLQKDLNTWLKHYNRERPHLGYRNNGRTPYATLQMFISPTMKKAA